MFWVIVDYVCLSCAKCTHIFRHILFLLWIFGGWFVRAGTVWVQFSVYFHLKYTHLWIKRAFDRQIQMITEMVTLNHHNFMIIHFFIEIMRLFSSFSLDLIYKFFLNWFFSCGFREVKIQFYKISSVNSMCQRSKWNTNCAI